MFILILILTSYTYFEVYENMIVDPITMITRNGILTELGLWFVRIYLVFGRLKKPEFFDIGNSEPECNGDVCVIVYGVCIELKIGDVEVIDHLYTDFGSPLMPLRSPINQIDIDNVISNFDEIIEKGTITPLRMVTEPGSFQSIAPSIPLERVLLFLNGQTTTPWHIILANTYIAVKENGVISMGTGKSLSESPTSYNPIPDIITNEFIDSTSCVNNRELLRKYYCHTEVNNQEFCEFYNNLINENLECGEIQAADKPQSKNKIGVIFKWIGIFRLLIMYVIRL